MERDEEIRRLVEEEIRRRLERGELTRVDNPEVPRLARLYDVTPRRREETRP